MKGKDSTRQFERKKNHSKASTSRQKESSYFEALEESIKYMSPRSQNQLSFLINKSNSQTIHALHFQIYKLQQQVHILRQQNKTLSEQNQKLQNIISRHKQNQENNQYHQSATVEVLNELKQKIQLLNDDDEKTSTFDSIDILDVCFCKSYEIQLAELRCKVKILEESLLHSEQIIVRLNEQNVKIKEKFSFCLEKISFETHRSVQHSKNHKPRISSQRYIVCPIKQTNEDLDD